MSNEASAYNQAFITTIIKQRNDALTQVATLEGRIATLEAAHATEIARLSEIINQQRQLLYDEMEDVE